MIQNILTRSHGSVPWKYPCSLMHLLSSCWHAETHQVLQSVIEKGWGGMDAGNDAEAVLKCEEEKAWAVIRDVAPDMRVFDVLSYPKLYHNLKAAVKEVYAGMKNPAMFYDDCPIPGEEMYRIVENRDFSRLPGNMGRTAQEARTCCSIPGTDSCAIS